MKEGHIYVCICVFVCVSIFAYTKKRVMLSQDEGGSYVCVHMCVFVFLYLPVLKRELC